MSSHALVTQAAQPVSILSWLMYPQQEWCLLFFQQDRPSFPKIEKQPRNHFHFKSFYEKT